jgi:hypothetical protein
MFELIDFQYLVPGNKYKIKTNGPKHEYTGTFKRHVHLYILYHSFDNVIDTHTRINYGTCDICPSHFRSVYYYAFVPQKERIQQDMEQRALDKILKRLVNDDFTW